MNKRIAYPLIIVMVYIIFNITLRLLNYGLMVEGTNPQVIFHIYNASDIFMIMFVPAILLFEQLNNSNIKKYFYLYLCYIVYSAAFNVLALTNILDSDGLVWSVPLYIILFAIVYVGYLEDKDNNKIYRIGRSIMLSGVVNLVYLFVIPSNVERLLFTYDMLSLNPLTFIILIMQMLVLDDVLLERSRKIETQRVTL